MTNLSIDEQSVTYTIVWAAARGFTPTWSKAGQQCDGVEAPCCTHPNMPLFTKTLGEITTEDIQLRLCNDHGIGDEETLLQLIDLYVY